MNSLFSSLGRDFGLGGSTLEMTGSLGVGVELILRISSFESREMEPGQVPEKDAEKVAEKIHLALGYKPGIVTR